MRPQLRKRSLRYCANPSYEILLREKHFCLGLPVQASQSSELSLQLRGKFFNLTVTMSQLLVHKKCQTLIGFKNSYHSMKNNAKVLYNSPKNRLENLFNILYLLPFKINRAKMFNAHHIVCIERIIKILFSPFQTVQMKLCIKNG